MGLLDTIRGKKPQPIQPVRNQHRCRCPFYGFALLPVDNVVLMDQEGNQCALIMDSYSPCYMQMQGNEGDWDICSFNTEESKESIEQLFASGRIAPKEFWPDGQSSWDGLSLAEWYTYIMERPHP